MQKYIHFFLACTHVSVCKYLSDRKISYQNIDYIYNCHYLFSLNTRISSVFNCGCTTFNENAGKINMTGIGATLHGYMNAYYYLNIGHRTQGHQIPVAYVHMKSPLFV